MVRGDAFLSALGRPKTELDFCIVSSLKK